MFRESIKFHSPTTVEIEHGASQKLEQYLKRLGVEKALLITDNVLVDLGMTDTLLSYINDKSIEIEIFSDVLPEPPLENVRDAFTLYKETGCNGVIAIGGGSPIDVAKAVAMLATNPGEFTEYTGIGNVPNKCAPLITIPTTSGTGSEVSIFSIILVDGSKAGIIDSNICADVALVDPELTLSLPKAVTAATGIDTFCHHLESFLSVKSSPLSNAIALEGLRTVSKHLRKVVGNGNNKESRFMMSYASTLGGYCMNLTDGAAANHALAFSLGAKFNVGHGLSNAVLLPYVFPVIAKAEIEKTKVIGEAIGENISGLSDSAVVETVANAITQLVKDVGCLIPLSELGVVEDDIDDLIAEAKTQERVMNHSTYMLSDEEMKEIFINAL